MAYIDQFEHFSRHNFRIMVLLNVWVNPCSLWFEYPSLNPNFTPVCVIFRRYAGIPDFISGDDMEEMISSGRLDPKVIFAYVQEVYRSLKDNC